MNIALIGYGKMGHEIEKIAVSRGHKIVSVIDVDNIADFDSDAFRSADVAIEFSAPTAAYNNVISAFRQGVKVVSGTTVWFKDHEAEMKDLCEKGNTLFWSSNFSIGVSIFNALNRYLASIMNSFGQYNVNMYETHHIHKLDSPSGTAVTLADMIIAELDRKDGWENTLHAMGEVEHNEAPADDSKIHIDSYRRDEVPGIHGVHYESAADSITIVHDAKNRSGFALGAVMAAEYTAQHNGLLSMKDLFKF